MYTNYTKKRLLFSQSLLKYRMNSILIIIFISLAIATMLNLILKKLSVSHIIGYIMTGTIISTLFDFNLETNLEALNLIAEFGIVF